MEFENSLFIRGYEVAGLLNLTDEYGRSCSIALKARHIRTLVVMIQSWALDKDLPLEMRGFRRGKEVGQELALLVGEVAAKDVTAVRHYFHALRSAIKNEAKANGLSPGIELTVVETVPGKGYRLGTLGRDIRIVYGPGFRPCH